MTDREKFLFKIREEPDEDTHRLVYADWLDENAPATVVCPDHHHYDRVVYDRCPTCCGTGSVPAPERGHADLIRVQCELAPYPNASDTPQPRHMTPTSKWLELRRRERDLLALHETAWRAGPVCERCMGVYTGGLGYDNYATKCTRCGGTGDAGGLLRNLSYGRNTEYGELEAREPVRIHFDRGFIGRVEVPRLSDVVAVQEFPSTRCPACHGDAAKRWHAGDRGAGCGTCGNHDTIDLLAPTSLLRQLLAPTPFRCVQEVIPLNVCDDAYLDGEAGEIYWRSSGIFDHECIPKELCPTGPHATRAAAVSVLGRAVVAFGRS